MFSKIPRNILESKSLYKGRFMFPDLSISVIVRHSISCASKISAEFFSKVTIFM